MSEYIDDGGYAFPNPSDDKAGWHAESGMTLRDWYAGKALSGLLASNHEIPPTTIEEQANHYARVSHIYADAMIAAKKVRHE